MPSSRGKKASKKAAKLPEGAKPLQRSSLPLPPKKNYPPISKAVEEYCDTLAASDWQPFYARPKQDVVGFYVICRWYRQEKSWAMLYVGHGHIKERLEAHFMGGHRSPINMYLSSFPRQSRNLIWIKWAKDQFYPYEGITLDEVIEGLAQLYNGGEPPAFNQNLDVGHISKKSDKLPENFSILNY